MSLKSVRFELIVNIFSSIWVSGQKKTYRPYVASAESRPLHVYREAKGEQSSQRMSRRISVSNLPVLINAYTQSEIFLPIFAYVADVDEILLREFSYPYKAEF